MGISIITPHYNSFSGLKSIFLDLKAQTSDRWEWIIVDDCSDSEIKEQMRLFFQQQPQVHLIFNPDKSNASRCRNIGAQRAQFEELVFLDADDFVLPNFVANRQGKVSEFKVFLNFQIINKRGETQPFSSIKTDFLNNFLKARYAWQTTAIVWNKNFFNQIGQFDENMTNLQDIEISIRALLAGKSWELIADNPVDFQYFVTPIDPKKRTVFKICTSVSYLLQQLTSSQQLTKEQLNYLKSYYFVCIRYYVRSFNKKQGRTVVKKVANTFRSLGVFSTLDRFKALVLLHLFSYKLISRTLFVKANRYFFKQ